MKTLKSILSKIFLLLLVIIVGASLSSCSSSKLKTSNYDFIYNGKSYTIRSSYCPNNPKSCNQLIGKDFVAVDMNQDRVMDKIAKGDISLAEAQEIYDYCLNMLEKAGKLSKVDKKINQFELTEGKYTFYIKGFEPKDQKPFTEFRIIDKRLGFNQYKESIFKDNNADGILDEILKAGMLIEEAQKLYHQIIEKGIKQKKLEFVKEILKIK